MAIIINGINSGMVSLVDQHPVISLDLSTRQFTWPTDYKVVAIMGDANSQKLTFEVPAIYEGIDLTDTTCVLTYWTSWTNDEGKHSTGTVNLELTELENAKEGYLYYTWTLDQNQTANSGEVKFKIGFYLVLDEFDPSGYEDLSYIITDGHLAIYNNLELILTTDNYYALSSNSGTFNVIPDGISEQTKIHLVDWATKAEQAANEATGAANNANTQAERAKQAANNANTATDDANGAATEARNNIADLSNLTARVEKTEGDIGRLQNDYTVNTGQIETLANEIEKINDYIVEQGTSDIWSYRKWHSGIAECWISHKEISFPPENITDQTGIEGLKTSFVDVPLPFTFIEFPSTIASCRWKTTEFIECQAFNTNTIRFRWYGVDSSFTNEPANTLTVSVQVKGKLP